MDRVGCSCDSSPYRGNRCERSGEQTRWHRTQTLLAVLTTRIRHTPGNALTQIVRTYLYVRVVHPNLFTSIRFLHPIRELRGAGPIRFSRFAIFIRSFERYFFFYKLNLLIIDLEIKHTRSFFDILRFHAIPL